MVTKLHGNLSELTTIVLPQLFPKAVGNIYYDELNDQLMCNLHHFDESSPDKAVGFDDGALLVIQNALELKLTNSPFDGYFPKATIDDAIHFIGYKNPRNTRREWLEGLVWDGKPRVRTCFRDTIGGDVANLSEEEKEQYLGDVTVAWMVGSIARQYEPTQVDVVPLLMGEQRIGKGTTIRYITGNSAWYKDTYCDVNNPKAFLESIRGCAIVELSEASAISSKESEKVKAFISMREDRYRKSYAKEAGTYPRRWVAIATSNLKTPFTDITGNMRYFPIYCEDKSTNLIHKFREDPAFAKEYAEQLWAEAMYLYKHGATPFLSDETRELAINVQDNATTIDDAIDYLNDTLNSDPKYNKAGAFLNREDIQNIMRGSSYSGDYFEHKNTFIFKWYNGKNCDWYQTRIRVTDQFGNVTQPRGYMRRHDAKELI